MGHEQTYYSALKVYKLLGVPDRIGTLRVPGFHGANDEEADLDWLDQQFGRSTKKWTNNLIFQWNWDTWRTETKTALDLGKYPKHGSDDLLKSDAGGMIASTADWEKKSEEVRKSVVAMLGTCAADAFGCGFRRGVLRRCSGGGAVTRPASRGARCSGCGSRRRSGWLRGSAPHRSQMSLRRILASAGRRRALGK